MSAAGFTNWTPLPGTSSGIAFPPSRCYPLGMTTLSIKLPESLAERITRAAAEEGISRSEYLRKAALDRLKPRPRSKEKKPTPAELASPFRGCIQEDERRRHVLHNAVVDFKSQELPVPLVELQRAQELLPLGLEGFDFLLGGHNKRGREGFRV